MSRLFSVLSVGLMFVFSTGCAKTTSSETAGSSSLTSSVGNYSPPPTGNVRPRLGCPSWQVAEKGRGANRELNDLGGDIATTLTVNSERFKVVERAQLQQLLKEQGLEGIVRPGELATPSNVRGVDFLLIGKISNMRVKREKVGTGFGVGDVKIPFGGRLGGLDIDTKKTKIIAEMGVDIRMVDPSTGEVAAAMFSDFKRTDAASAMGVKILGARAKSTADLQIDEDSKGLLMRLAIDDALRKMLPKVDRFLATYKPKSE